MYRMLQHFSDMLVHIPIEFSYVGTCHLCVRETKWSSLVTGYPSVTTEDSSVATKDSSMSIKYLPQPQKVRRKRRREKGKENEKAKEKKKENNNIHLKVNITDEDPTELMSSFSKWINEGLYKDHAKNVVPENENKIVDTIKGFGIPAGLPWHLTNEFYAPVNCNGEFHWVLVVIVLMERSTKVYDSMPSSRINRKLSIEIQKLSTMLPKYLESSRIFEQKDRINLDCELFVAVYAEFLSDGLQVPSYGIISQSLRMRYASLLWNYEILNAWSDYVSDNDDPQRPRPIKTKFISPDKNMVVTTID
ncbi:hypothetical protein H5410_046250 [Solanum commersonii]|uniref:Ubiquitin-like protease family profile domain-containing protein n=1 Tax=Solanum commersonii TaxID=4109 RepID=A0A9J5XFZ3_SOLCO|nr:hypothetical protein H5410_046250 [Solanum commersonii]